MMKQVTSRILYQKKSIKLGLLREEKIKKEVKILKMRLNNLHFPLMGKEKKIYEGEGPQNHPHTVDI